MSNEKKQLTQLDKANEGHHPSDKALQGETIKSKDDNAMTERHKARDAVKSFKLTRDDQESCIIVGLTDKSGKQIVVKDERPLRQDNPPGTKDFSLEPVTEKHTSQQPAAIDKHSASHDSKHDGMHRVTTESHDVVQKSGENIHVTTYRAHEAAKIDDSSKHSDSALEKSKERLLQTMENLKAHHKLSEAEFKRFKQNMDRMEERVNKGYDDPSEAQRTYEQLDKLLTAPKARISEQNRIVLAEDVMEHAAWPHKISQGHYNTCNVTTVEEQLFTRYPSKAAEIATSVALHSEFISLGKRIKIDADSLIPREESRKSPPADGQRSYATQLLNVALVNDTTQRLHPPQFYSQIPSDRDVVAGGNATHPADNADHGERMTDGHGHEIINERGNPRRGAGAASSAYAIATEMARLTGRHDVMITNATSIHDTGILHVSSPAQLDDVLRHHKMPMIIGIDANNPPWNLSHGPGQHNMHVITIQSYDAASHTAHVSNQWHNADDIDVSVDVLYQATLHTIEPPAPPVPPVPAPPGSEGVNMLPFSLPPAVPQEIPRADIMPPTITPPITPDKTTRDAASSDSAFSDF